MWLKIMLYSLGQVAELVDLGGLLFSSFIHFIWFYFCSPMHFGIFSGIFWYSNTSHLGMLRAGNPRWWLSQLQKVRTMLIVANCAGRS